MYIINNSIFWSLEIYALNNRCQGFKYICQKIPLKPLIRRILADKNQHNVPIQNPPKFNRYNLCSKPNSGQNNKKYPPDTR